MKRAGAHPGREGPPAGDFLAVQHAAGAWLVIGAVLLAGCESLMQPAPTGFVPAQPEVTWQAHARALYAFETWTMLGTLTVRADGERARVKVQWRQTPESYLLRFTGPLGVGLFEVAGGAGTVQAKFPGGRSVAAASPEALLEEEIGWSVPLAGLRYWIVGVPAPDGTPATLKIDNQGRLVGLEQSGWTVVYEAYGLLGGLPLPARVRFSNESVHATVVVRQWQAARDPV